MLKMRQLPHFYHYIEQWSFLDALYFSTTTMTTVGYGDLTPKTDAGKLFTIIYIFLGVGIVLYSLSLFAAHFVERREEFWLERLGSVKIRRGTTSQMRRGIASSTPKVIKSIAHPRRYFDHAQKYTTCDFHIVDSVHRTDRPVVYF